MRAHIGGGSIVSEELAKKHWKTAGHWRLLDETVYQFNHIYREFWRNGGKSLSRAKPDDPNEPRGSWVVPAMFDKQSRTFNWVALADPLLDAQGGQNHRRDMIAGVIEHLSNSFKQGGWEESREEFRDLFDDSPHCSLAVDTILAEIERFDDFRSIEEYKTEQLKSERNAEKLFHSICQIYSSYSHPRQHSLEGCAYMALERFGNSRPDIVKDGIFGKLWEGGTLKLDDWMRSRGLTEDDWSFVEWEADEKATIDKPRQIDGCGFKYQECRRRFAGPMSAALLDSVYMSWKSDFSSQGGERCALSDHLANLEHRLLIPIYDVWIGSEGFGGIHGVMLVFLPKPSAEECGGVIGHSRWDDVYNKYILPRSEGFANQIAATSIRRALATPVSSPFDLLSHFLKVLVEVQDWDEAVVFRDDKPIYRYTRAGVVHSPQGGQAESYLRVRIPWQIEDKFQLEGDNAQSGSLVNDGEGALYMWWTNQRGWDPAATRGHADLWSEEFLPELTDAERSALQGLSIRFKFPKATRIPVEDHPLTRDVLVETYQRQQLDLMRALIPKVRSRRVALRNAVSAIMGRNMSHNIGSHVLARYASYSKKKGGHVGSVEDFNPLADFLSYLQRRMDFLAEVSTADTSYWSQPLLLGRQLEKLNYEKQRAVYKGGEDGFPPILQFITGKDDLTATVEFGKEDGEGFLSYTDTAFGEDFLFACPGGEVGMHALYAILENIIRNSARHNSSSHSNPTHRGSVRLQVIAKELEGTDLIKVRIIDPGSDLGRDSSTLPDRINRIIAYEAILDQDGAPNPEYWGLREMQICAQYLRELPLSDLQIDIRTISDSSLRETLKRCPVFRAEAYKIAKDQYCLSYVLHLPKAKLVAKIGSGGKANTDRGWSIPEAPGFVEFALPAERNGHRPQEKAEPRWAASHDDDADHDILTSGIARFAFAVYDDTNEHVVNWVQRHKTSLPIRCLPVSAIEDVANPLEGDPMACLEVLHRAHAEMLVGPSDGRRVVGVISELGGLPRAKDRLGAQTEGKHVYPLACIHRDEIPQWTGKAGSVQATIWIDHVNDDELRRIEYWVGKSQEKLRKKGEAPLKFLAWEACFANTPATDAIEALKPGEGWELMAASVARVTVLDERVQAEADSEFRTLKLARYWDGMRVAVPPECQIKLDSPSMNACREWLGSLEEPQDLLVVHLTVLEKLCDDAGLDNAISVVEELVKDKECLANCVIAVVTGRGVSTFGRSIGRQPDSEVAQRIRYLPISTLLEHLIQRPSKLGLMRVLWSASKPKEG